MEPKSLKAKLIRFSEKRQITIPKFFYEKLRLEDTLICELRGNELILRPVPTEEDFSEEILKDLVLEGYEEAELIAAFQKRKKQIQPAIEALLTEADRAAQVFTGTGDEETAALFSDVRE